jgi:hypothetical protein
MKTCGSGVFIDPHFLDLTSRRPLMLYPRWERGPVTHGIVDWVSPHPVSILRNVLLQLSLIEP